MSVIQRLFVYLSASAILFSMSIGCAGTQTRDDDARENMRERSKEAHDDLDREMEERGKEDRPE